MRSRSLLLFFAYSALHAQNSYTISTVAGAATDLFGYTGDGGPASEARINKPAALALDDEGNLYIADTWNNAVRVIDRSGRIRTVAGTGVEGFSGDGGPAVQAKLCYPEGVAADSHHNLYIADTINRRIRRVTPDGIISTIAGTGENGSTGDGDPALKARLTPDRILIDSSGTLYFTDSIEGLVRKISPDGVISTIARFGQFDRPAGMAIDATGSLYVPLNVQIGLNGRVVKVDRSGIVTPFAGRRTEGSHFGADAPGDGGPALAADVPHPSAVAFDHDGNLLIAAGRIRRVDHSGIIDTVPGGQATGPFDVTGKTMAKLGNPSDIVVDPDGNIYAADSARIMRITPAGTVTRIAGLDSFADEAEGGPVDLARLGNPWGIATSSAGELFIADTGMNRILRVRTNGSLSRVAGKGLPIVRIEGSGPPPQFSGDGGPAGKADLDDPTGVAVDAHGNIFISDSLNNRIRKVTTDGRIQTIAGSGQTGFSGDGGPAISATLAHPMGLAVDASGNVYVADRENNRIRKITPDGIITTVVGTGMQALSGEGPALSISLNFPHGVAVDNKGRLYVADTFNHRILRLDSDGIVRLGAGTGQQEFTGDEGPAVKAGLGAPDSLAIDAQGNIYIADRANWRIRKITTDGIIHTIAGNGATGYYGDGSPAIKAPVFPTGIAVGPDGVVYLTDHNRIRKLTPNANP